MTGPMQKAMGDSDAGPSTCRVFISVVLPHLVLMPIQSKYHLVIATFIDEEIKE